MLKLKLDFSYLMIFVPKCTKKNICESLINLSLSF